MAITAHGVQILSFYKVVKEWATYRWRRPCAMYHNWSTWWQRWMSSTEVLKLFRRMASLHVNSLINRCRCFNVRGLHLGQVVHVHHFPMKIPQYSRIQSVFRCPLCRSTPAVSVTLTSYVCGKCVNFKPWIVARMDYHSILMAIVFCWSFLSLSKRLS